jgi:hypothetical protein
MYDSACVIRLFAPIFHKIFFLYNNISAADVKTQMAMADDGRQMADDPAPSRQGVTSPGRQMTEKREQRILDGL